VNSFLKEKADKQLNCLIRLLGEHSHFNRINLVNHFGIRL
jgi:hypothetical protein